MSNQQLIDAIRMGTAARIMASIRDLQVSSEYIAEAIVAARAKPEDTVERWCYWDGTGELATRTMARKRLACEALCRIHKLDDRQVQRVTITRGKP